MLKTYKYRLNPTKKQRHLFESTLTECRWVYNHLLDQRKTAWEQNKKSLNYHDQAVSLPPLKERRPTLKTVHSQVIQNVAVRIDLAFKAFFRRIKIGDKPGFPRFKGEFRYDSFTFPQSGFAIIDKKLNLSKIGYIKIKLHRSVEGTVKTCTIKRTSTKKWFVYFVCEVAPKPLPACSKATGIDVGLTSFATLSNGEKIPNHRFFRQEEKALAKSQRKLSKQTKGTRKRYKARKIVARIHERITNKRHNFCHQTARKLINSFDTIAVEDLNINNMQKDNFRCINKSIGDAAWRIFFDILSQKAVEAARKVIKVNPAYTSQDCSQCGYRQIKKLFDRVHNCSCCGLVLDRDHNAALNILALGTHGLARLSAGTRSPLL